MKKSIFDTNILTAFLKDNSRVVNKVAKYLDEYDKLTISVITYYEILRGLKEIKSKKKLKLFYEMAEKAEIIILAVEIMDKASDVYLELKKKGELIEDADILVAASAIVNNLILITDNERHFRRIKRLEVENWLH
ncbi:MAG: type II toxin-antitoxin system VapC family toxin [bacterium]